MFLCFQLFKLITFETNIFSFFIKIENENRKTPVGIYIPQRITKYKIQVKILGRSDKTEVVTKVLRDCVVFCSVRTARTLVVKQH